MGLLDRIFSRNQVNELPTANRYGSYWFTPLDKWEMRKYSDEHLWLILQTIFNGMKNVRFFSDVEDERIASIIYFLDKNFATMIWQMWHTGMIVVGKQPDGTPYLPEWNDVKIDKNGKVENFDVVYYSEKYMYERKSDFSIIKETLDAIDIYANGDLNLCQNFGALGILTGKGLPTSPADKDAFQQELKHSYGIQREKKQILLTTMPLDFKQMTLPVKQLELMEKITEHMKLLCRYFCVPTDLIIGGSTFNNQAQATINFYRGCIAPLAEIALKVGQYMMKKDAALLVPSNKLTFRIDNVAELEDDRTAEIEYKMKIADLVTKMRELDLDTTEYEEQLKTILS